MAAHGHAIGGTTAHDTLASPAAALWRFGAPVWAANLVVLVTGALAGLTWGARCLRAPRHPRAERASRSPA